MIGRAAKKKLIVGAALSDMSLRMFINDNVQISKYAQGEFTGS